MSGDGVGLHLGPKIGCRGNERFCDGGFGLIPSGDPCYAIDLPVFVRLANGLDVDLPSSVRDFTVLSDMVRQGFIFHRALNWNGACNVIVEHLADGETVV